ncbi:MAG: PAS domain S-box protein [Thermoleophilia bacterium]
MPASAPERRAPAPRLAARSAVLAAVLLLVVAGAVVWATRAQGGDDARARAVSEGELVARALAASGLTTSDLTAPATGAALARLDGLLAPLLDGDVVRVDLWHAGGTLSYSTDHARIGAATPWPGELERALRGAAVGADGAIPAPGRPDGTLDVSRGTAPLRPAGEERTIGAVTLHLRPGEGAPGVGAIAPPLVAAVALCLLAAALLLLAPARRERRALAARGERAEARAASLERELRERDEAETALRASERRLRSLFERANDLIATFDLEGRVTDVNGMAEAFTGYRREELLGMVFLDLVAPEDRPRAAWQRERKLRGLATTTTYELEIVRKDGCRLAIDISSSRLDEGGSAVGFQAICRDVSERRELEKQLGQSQKMEAVGQLAGGVAHDFNNLLTAIRGYAELLLARLDRDGAPDGPRRDAEEIMRAAERASGLTRQLLAFSRREISRREPVDVNALVRGVEGLLRRTIGEQIELTTALDAPLPCVEADPGQLEQVVLNLALNGRDAMPAGGKLLLETRLVHLDAEYARRHAGVAPGPYVRIAVSDSGSGMPEEVRARAFEPFFTTKPRGQGTGLGLAIVYGIVRRAGGHVFLYSEPGRGTSAKVLLPASAAAGAIPRPARERLDRRGGTETILVVEDEPAVLELCRRVLGVLGYRVLTEANGRDGLHLLQQDDGRIDLLLTDVVLPELSGRELVERVRAARPGLPVVFMSGYTDDVVVRMGVLQGDVPFLEKPFSADRLLAVVRETLDAARAAPAA